MGLLDALVERLATRPLPVITVRELCDEVGIVEQTFFNIFGGKPALLMFYVMLWSIEMQWRMQRAASAEQGLQRVFEQSAERMQETPWLMPEIIIHQLRGHADGLPPCAPPTLGDKLLRFSDMPGAAALEPLPIQQLLGHGVRRAVAGGELPADTDQELLTRLLCGLFFGAAASSPEPAVVAQILVRGFDALWLAHSKPKEKTA
ncbi:MAG: TetR/AcrR family transcriptional regulator [Myxococcales bacterium]|nr:TetR/AcrR family transcriptional regulator [Myxococcales bacterium]